MAHPLDKDSNGRYPVIEAVIAELGSRKSDPLDRVAYLLRNCGILAERNGECVVLSDNAHRYDCHFLAPWLPFGPETLETFPWVMQYSRVGGEGGSFAVGPDRFLQRTHGYKTPAFALDGLVAYLVKALSAAGVITCWSCAGHFGYLGVGMQQGCSSAWTEILVRHVQDQMSLANCWKVENGLLTVHYPADRDWIRFYLEVLDVADLLYRERVRLREIRGKVVEQMDKRAEEWAYEDILSKMKSLVSD